MLYLHCGWPRTGTTSLQAALDEHREALADAGVVYVRRSSKGHPDIERSIEAHPDADLLLSDEGLTNMLRTDDRCNDLLTHLRAVQEVTPVICLWIIRRVDEVAHSGWIEMAARGLAGSTPVEFVSRFPPLPLFANMRRVEEAVGGRAVYFKYRSSGAHITELLSTLDLPPYVVAEITSSFRSSTRLNTSRTRKQLAVLLHSTRIGERLGIELDRAGVLEAFDRAGLRFEDDGPCELVGKEVRRAAHDRATVAALEAGFSPYPRLVGDQEVGDIAPPSELGIEALGDDDMERLANCLRSFPGACSLHD